MNLDWVLSIALLMLAASGLAAWRTPRLWLAFVMAGAGFMAWAAVCVLAGEGSWQWRSLVPVGGEFVHLRLDGVSALFLVLLALVGSAGAVYAREYWGDRTHPASGRAGRFWWSGLMTSMGLVLVVSNGLHFLIAWEAFAVCAYFLITLDRGRSEVRRAGWLYLAASHAGTLALFAFFALLAARVGSWELGPVRDRAGLAPLFWLAFFGFGVKAGLFPLHVWLPSAHANAPSHVSAIMSGVAIKMGIYGLVRFSGWLPLPAGAGWAVAAVGMVSAVLGVAYALGQHDLKRLLAYHSVENIGIILLGLGFAMIALAGADQAPWGSLALAGGLLHVWNHGLFKSLLFFGAGSVLHATGTREMSRLGGLWRAMPWTASLFALGAAAISGLPPLNGFVSEWLIYLGMFDAVGQPGSAALAAIAGIVLLAVTGALALACFVKVCSVVFLGAPRSKSVGTAHECGAWMRWPMVVLAAACVAIGLGPVFFWPAAARAASAWLGGAASAEAPASLAVLTRVHVSLAVLGVIAAAGLWRLVVRRGLARRPTWDCGYAAPDARMQYTAGSFAGIITEWFAWALRPVRHETSVEGVHPREALREDHTPETVLEYAVEPVAGWVLRLSSAVRRLQHGRMQAYLLYLVLGLVGVAVVIVAGGGS